MPTWLPFNEEKATQVAGRLLQHAGGSLPYLKLIKLLYYVDRKAILNWGRPVTTDRLVSMPHGPMVSRIYDLISVGPDASPSSWHAHIKKISYYDVQLVEGLPLRDDELSPIEEALIDEIWTEHGWKNKWALRDETHDLPEWQDPNGSSKPIEYADILGTENTPQDEINMILSEIEDLAVVQCLQATAG